MNFSYDFLYVVLYVSLICSILLFALSLLLFIVFKIPSTISMLSGTAARKAIKQMEANGTIISNKTREQNGEAYSYKTDEMKGKSKTTKNKPKGLSVKQKSLPVSAETKLLTEELNKTVLLTAEQNTGETALLSAENSNSETVVLIDEANQDRERQFSIAFKKVVTFSKGIKT